MSGIESVPKELRGRQTAGEITYEPIRDLSSLEREYLTEFFDKMEETAERGRKLFYFTIPPLALISFVYNTYINGWNNVIFMLFLFLNLIIYMYARQKGNEKRTLENPVVEIERELSYGSVSFSIVGSGLHVGGFQVGFPQGWGKKINFFQFTGKEVTLEVYITGPHNLILAIEGEGHDGNFKRLTLKDALEEGLIDMKDARSG